MMYRQAPAPAGARAGAARQLEVSLGCAALPVGIGFDVYVQDGTLWRPLGQIACPAGTAREWRMIYDAPLALPGGGGGGGGDGGRRSGTAALLFEPSADAAARSLDTFEIWNGRLRFDRVGVVDNSPAVPERWRRPRAVTPPAARRATAPD